MAEPEGLEDDLFADLYVHFVLLARGLFCLTLFPFSYDADESTNRTTSAVEVPKPTDVTEPAVPAQPAGDALTQGYDNSAAEAYHAQATPQQDFGGYQNGSETASGTPAAAPSENEPRGTGIKEDG